MSRIVLRRGFELSCVELSAAQISVYLLSARFAEPLLPRTSKLRMRITGLPYAPDRVPASLREFSTDKVLHCGKCLRCGVRHDAYSIPMNRKGSLEELNVFFELPLGDRIFLSR